MSLFIISDEDAGVRLDVFLAHTDLTRSAAQKLIESGDIKVNGATVAKSIRLQAGDLVEAHIPEPEPLSLTPENIPLDILYEDAELIVVNKPKGMVVHPAPGHYTGTLVHALLFHCQGSLTGLNGVQRPGVVHRIDKDTSGVLVFAKTDAAYLSLAAQISAHTVDRCYHAIIVGRLKQEDFTIDKPIGRHPIDRKKMAVTEKNSRNAVTHIHVLETLKGFTYIEARLETGRTHQIRVHMASMGYPLLGDEVYGGPRCQTPGQALHAKRLGFEHPRTGEWMRFETDLPVWFQELLEKNK